MNVSYERNRGSVFLEDARILAQRAWPGEQFVLRVQAPKAARKAKPGTFAHIARWSHSRRRRRAMAEPRPYDGRTQRDWARYRAAA